MTSFSAILPNYNSAAYLPKSIDSLIAQNKAFDEIIIVDDGSTDESLTIIAAYQKLNANIRVLRHEQNQGVCQALNTGIAHATGDYLILCAADDTYHPNMVTLANAASEKAEGIGLICGDAMVTRFDLKNSFHRTLSFPFPNTPMSPQAFENFAKKNYVAFNGGGGMFLNRRAVLASHCLHPELRWHCDWLLYFVVAFRHGIYYINEVFVYIDMRKEGYAEGKRNAKVQNEVMRDTLKILHTHYPDLWEKFKQSALLPHYSPRYVPLFLIYPHLRKYLTVTLFWKLLLNNAMVIRIGRLFPYRIILAMRKLLRA